MDVDFEELAMFLEALEASDFTHFIFEKGDARIEVRRGSASEPLASASTPTVVAPSVAVPTKSPAAAPASAILSAQAPASTAAHAVAGDIEITSPLLGTVYLSPKPGEPPFVEIGARVSAGAPVCIIEVMKLMNSVEAPVDGTIVDRHVSDGELVEFGQVVFTIRPDGQ
ncbi:acetyl-CoA carboxylase biotin carboxyl carrier protein [Microbacterium protaetiae]|uniref:Biotin carboxyl carrier protein of acetyl-CoA carboxylase n=1 Tax=Microbacterium protaetiae TaxID=2509458 RepID=A0A4P6EN52_9MICO|nr:acetyl-CoA carboxylase biotin carboxyl carrier protein [Microbacterium protaetiae]QAY59318.1 acetyl-CoA carboxylase biotin carboxyl carrier protein [Microbacterium protaetiae]